MSKTYFEIMARGLEGPMSEGPIESFSSRENAERRLNDLRINEFQVRYWIVERAAIVMPCLYQRAFQKKNGNWVAISAESRAEALKEPSWMYKMMPGHSSKDEALAHARRRHEERGTFFERIEVVEGEN